MGKGARAVLGFIVAFLVSGIVLVTAFGGADKAKAQEVGPGGGIATDAPVPGWARVLIDKQAGKCPQVTASLLAAQLYRESKFDAAAKSPAGAVGIAQFMPLTWGRHGVDGDHDGKKDPRDPADAVAAQAAYDCSLAREVENVPGDSTENMLAAYNAGVGAVLEYRGIPPYPETRDYVERIRRLAGKWAEATTGSPGAPAGERATRVVDAAKAAVGSWYRWGGRCVSPYRGEDGCDCSSLVKMAWGKAGVNLPRTTYDQVHAGRAVAGVSQLQPGDLLFSVPESAGPGHVAMYLGDDWVIDAPHTGAQVRITPLSYWKSQVTAMRHVD